MRLHAITASAALTLAACATPTSSSSFAGDPAAGYNALLAAQQSAQASAIRANDDLLSCQQLQAEMAALANDPAYTAATASSLANAQAMADIGNEMQASAGAMTAVGLLGSLPVDVPGLQIFNMAAAQATRAHMEAQQARSQAAAADSLAEITAMQPFIYRTQRVVDLAMARDCKFINGG